MNDSFADHHLPPCAIKTRGRSHRPPQTSNRSRRPGHPLRALTKPIGRFMIAVTWAEVIRKLKAAGFVEVRSGKGSHLLLKHPSTGKEVWVAVHTKKDAGRLGNRILRDAGVE